jgi:cell fate (sporulation/competence/biofilm development) regulator YlbF (YheA/YmcA/DUF963 family)
MEHIFENARSLAEDIRNSGPYKNYLSAKAAVDSQPELASLLSEYQFLVGELAKAEDNNEPDLLPYKQRVSEAYFAAASDGRLSDFLEAERAVVALVCDVLEIVAGNEISLRGEL